MSVNLKGRNKAQSEAVIQAPQELVMAGGQTPWASDLANGGTANPFDGPDTNLPPMPPPPPSYAPGEEPVAEAKAGRKLPLSKPVLIGIAAVLVVGGGGYLYKTMSSSSPATPPPPVLRVHHVVHPGVGTAKTGVGTAKTGKAVTPAHPVTPVKPPVTAVKPVKPVVPPTTGKAVVATTPKGTAAIVAPAYTWTAALPGQIGNWAKLAVVTAKPGASDNGYQKDLGTTIKNAQFGIFGPSVLNPYLVVAVGDHTAVQKQAALGMAGTLAVSLRAADFAVASPVAEPHQPWGGTAACGTATRDDVLWVYCAWTDHNTDGVFMAPNRAASNALSIMNMVRSSVEH